MTPTKIQTSDVLLEEQERLISKVYMLEVMERARAVNLLSLKGYNIY